MQGSESALALATAAPPDRVRAVMGGDFDARLRAG
jgi:hypothetical protein